jgi:hypothetical protein
MTEWYFGFLFSFIYCVWVFGRFFWGDGGKSTWAYGLHIKGSPRPSNYSPHPYPRRRHKIIDSSTAFPPQLSCQMIYMYVCICMERERERERERQMLNIYRTQPRKKTQKQVGRNFIIYLKTNEWISPVTSSKGWGEKGMKKENRWDRERRVEGVGSIC